MATPASGLQRKRDRGVGAGVRPGRAGDDESGHSTRNPDYRRTGPQEIDVAVTDAAGNVRLVRCVNTDAEAILAVRDHYVSCGVK